MKSLKTQKQIQGHEYRARHLVNQSGLRLDQFLLQRYPFRSRERLKQAIEAGWIQIVRNLKQKHKPVGRVKPSFLLQPGDWVEVLSIRRKEPEVDFNYKILFEDPYILVINKPARLPVHPAGRFFFHTLLMHLKSGGAIAQNQDDFTYSTQEVAQLEKDFYLPHRIDKETSGILVIAKDKEVCASLVKQFAERETEKAYLAIVRGQPKQSSFWSHEPIGKKSSSKIGLKMHAVSELEGGLPSSTFFQALETRTLHQELYTLLACYPKTGRQHQIRAHADIAGLPLLGDKIYGWPEDLVDRWLTYHSHEHLEEDDPSEEDIELLEDEQKLLILPRHALHAAGLKFTHPMTQKAMIFKTTLPDDLATFFNSLPLVQSYGDFEFPNILACP